MQTSAYLGQYLNKISSVEFNLSPQRVLNRFDNPEFHLYIEHKIASRNTKIATSLCEGRQCHSEDMRNGIFEFFLKLFEEVLLAFFMDYLRVYSRP